MSRDFRRPRYTFDAGRITLGAIETDGDFIFAADEDGSLDYTIVNLTRALYKGKALVEGGEALFGLGYDAKPDRGGLGKLRYWRDKVVVR